MPYNNNPIDFLPLAVQAKVKIASIKKYLGTLQDANLSFDVQKQALENAYAHKDSNYGAAVCKVILEHFTKSPCAALHRAIILLSAGVSDQAKLVLLKVVNMLLKTGNIDVKQTEEETTLLEKAIYFSVPLKCIKLLLECDVQTNHIFHRIIIPMSAAKLSEEVQFKLLSITRMVIDKGADVNEIKGGKTPLACAIDFKASPQFIKLLLQKGAYIQKNLQNIECAQNIFLQSPTPYSFEIFYLIAAQRVADAEKDTSKLPFHRLIVAMSRTRTEIDAKGIVSLLLNANLELVNKPDDIGWTPLLYAILIQAPLACIEALLEKDAHIHQFFLEIAWQQEKTLGSKHAKHIMTCLLQTCAQRKCLSDFNIDSIKQFHPELAQLISEYFLLQEYSQYVPSLKL